MVASVDSSKEQGHGQASQRSKRTDQVDER
ncbi:hypothetical protein LCGC14_3013350, partial [marine sediment metagenome]